MRPAAPAPSPPTAAHPSAVADAAPLTISGDDPVAMYLWDALGRVCAAMGPEQFAPFMRSEVDKWRKVIKSSGITVD